MSAATSTDTIGVALAMNTALLNANLTDVDDEVAAKPAAPGANNALWLLGHIVYWRAMMAAMVGRAPVWAEDDATEFRGVKRGVPPVLEGWTMVTLRAALADATSRLDGVDGEALPPEVRNQLIQLLLHEAYHVGQLGLWRRTQGLAGVVGQ